MRIKRQELLAALAAVQPGLANKEIIEQTQSFIFLDGQVITYNDVVSVRHPLDLGFNGAVKADELYKLLRRHKSAEVDISKGENMVVVRTKTSQAEIVMDTEIRAPIEEVQVPLPEDEEWGELPTNFKDALRFCSTTVSVDMTKQLLTCIHFRGKVAESTDGFRITQYKLETGIEAAFLVPGSAIKHILNYTLEGVIVRNGWLHLLTDKGAVFSCRTYADDYPDLNRFLDVQGDQFTLPEGMDEVVERAVIFTSAEEFEADQYITIAVQSGKMTISGKGSHGRFREKIKSDYKGDGFQFDIHPGFLKEAYTMLRTCEYTSTQLKLSGPSFTHLLNLVMERK